MVRLSYSFRNAILEFIFIYLSQNQAFSTFFYNTIFYNTFDNLMQNIYIYTIVRNNYFQRNILLNF